MANPSPAPTPRTKPDAPASERRGFLTRFAALIIGGIAGFVPAVAGLAVFFDPLRRNGGSGKFLRVATLEAVPDDGIPREFPVIAQRVDAWNYSLEPVGAVYLRREKGQATPDCWTATCPHAGCFVAFDKETNVFRCPCHNSVFTADGQIIPPSPSPRPLDTLKCKILDQEILVKFENFYTGKAEKVVKT